MVLAAAALTRRVRVVHPVEGAMEQRDFDLAVRALAKGRLFRKLGRRTIVDLVERIRRDEEQGGFGIQAVPPGTVVFTGGDEADRMYVVLEGAFEERSATGGTLLWCPHPGEVVGEEALFADHPELGESGQPLRISTLVCVPSEKKRTRDGKLLVITQRVAEALIREHEELALAFIRGLATDSYRLFEEQRRNDEVTRTWFRDRSARLIVGPYAADKADMYVAVARTPSGDTCRYLPEHLCPIPGYEGVFLMVAARFPQIRQPCEPQVRPFSYNETTIFVPALHRSLSPPFLRPVLYTPALYPDSVLATLLGREIYGFPKRPGRTDIDADEGTARLTLDGEESMFMAFEDCALDDLWDAAGWLGSAGRCGAEALLGGADGATLARWVTKMARFLPYLPVAALKQIPATDQRRGEVAYDVNELALCPFRIRGVEELTGLRFKALRVGDALPFGGSTLHWPVGFRVRCDVDLMPGEQLRRYPRRYEPLVER